ncbi:toll/interleukin-1 receptor domain-containing protein [Aliarcobacter butzleri]|uniref:toll/interleukin-1 receptor domain-containing protein n=1 Tax=Aliarcobacter butzleri TaxID=28197 RepID=UPI0012611897|nr:toll/interleukin-1 receptor domain-containing protein [Aliarcobacter butzleri]MCT7614880.1 toll/interleukin-1 receptor domain-containing protein [Aliarcobacter butzleri]
MILQKICYQCDYGNREKLKEPIRELVTKYSNVDLGILPFVNNNIYQLEFYLIIEFEKKEFEKDIRETIEPFIIKELTSVSTLYLLEHIGKGRRFNVMNHIFPDQIDMFFKEFFIWPERKSLIDIGYSFDNSMFPPNTVFFSYSGINKKDLETIYSYLLGENLPVFFDLNNITLGNNINSTIEDSIKDCKGIVFFINQKFLNSKWCKKEEDLAYSNNKKIVYIIDQNLDKKEKERFNNILHIEQDFNSFDHLLIVKKILEIFNA